MASRHPQRMPYGYLNGLFEWKHEIKRVDSSEWWGSLADLSLLGRPPLYQLLTVPFVAVFGRSPDAVLGPNLAFLAMTIFFTYKLAGGGRAGLLAGVIVSSYPPILLIARGYTPSAAVPACVAITLFLLLSLARKPSPRVALLLGASLAFGMLIHPTYLWFCGIPTAAVGIYVLLFRNEPRFPPGFKDAPRWFARKVQRGSRSEGYFPAR